jgi:hypothetical protein
MANRRVPRTATATRAPPRRGIVVAGRRIAAGEGNMPIIRTPDERFANLPDFPFAPRYVDLGAALAGARMHYLDEGEIVLCLHSKPSWSYL